MRIRLLIVFCVTAAGVAVLPSSSSVVHAEDNCDKVIPIDAMEGVVLGTGASGVYVAGSIPEVIAGGGAAPTAALGAGEIVTAAAAGYVAFSGTCKFLDWTGWMSPDEVAPLVGGAADVTVGTAVPCRSYAAPYDTSDFTYYQCRAITVPTMWPNDTRLRSTLTSSYNLGDCVLTIGANTFEAPEPVPMYPSVNPSTCLPYVTGDHMRQSWESPSSTETPACNYTVSSSHCRSWSTIGGTTFVATNYCINGGMSASYFDTMGTAWSNSLSDGTVADVGGNCGVDPRAYVIAYTGAADGTGTVQAVFHPNPVARDKGWSRRVVTDVQCKGWDGVGTTGYWVRASSAVYYDREISVRPRIPECDDGEYADKILIQRIPTGITCDLGAQCIGSAAVVSYTDMPDTLATSAAPDWSICLTSNYVCDTLEMDGETCEWGGITSPAEFCDPARQAGTDALPSTAPRSTGVLEPIPADGEDPFDTATVATPPPDDGDGGTTVDIDIPIDPGGGLGTGTDEELEGECWPEGFGWFNPAQWVLRPIKCAFMWAFVPEWEELSTTFEEFKASALEQFPISVVAAAVDFLGTLGGELESPSGTGCFDMPSSLNMGVTTVALSDVCIGSGMSVSGGQRTTLFVIMLAPMVWAVLSHTRDTFIGRSSSKDDD